MSEHTKEPWAVGADNPPFYAGDTVVLGVKEGLPFVLAQCNHNFDELSRANARRIVACVNACQGIETETLESPGTLAEVVVEGRTRYLEEKSLADELEADLEMAIEFIKEGRKGDYESYALAKYREMRGK